MFNNSLDTNKCIIYNKSVMKGEMNMKLKQFFKKGVIVFTIYFIITLCVLLMSDRIERLEKGGFSSERCGIAIKLGR